MVSRLDCLCALLVDGDRLAVLCRLLGGSQMALHQLADVEFSRLSHHLHHSGHRRKAREALNQSVVFSELIQRDLRNDFRFPTLCLPPFWQLNKRLVPHQYCSNVEPQ